MRQSAFHKYLCWLDQIKGIGRKSVFSILQSACGTMLLSEEGLPEAEWTEDKDSTGDPAVLPQTEALAEAAQIIYKASETGLRIICGDALGTKTAAEKAVQLLTAARKREAERVEEDLMQAGISFFSILEDGYPQRLRRIPDPPFGIYCRGRMPQDLEPAAAVIGARLASGYGREQARRFAARLGSAGISVVSGMARGIDGIAQRAALDAGGSSFAVLGCGVDFCYPKENRDLYEGLLTGGGILSEYAPGTLPEARLFPARNRIISGLSDLVLVIEARKKSGTLITVDMALEQGKEVFALPGRVSDSLSDGCNRLIRQGASAATAPEDILEFYFGGLSDRPPESLSKTPLQETDMQEKIKTESDKLPAPERGRGEEEAAGSGACKAETSETGACKAEAEGAGASLIRRETKTDKYTSLERSVLKILSYEDGTHVERILEELNLSLAEKGEEPILLTSLISALMRLQICGVVREEMPGYYLTVRPESL